MLFTSNYDGSLEGYMGDLSTSSPGGSTPCSATARSTRATRWLILAGAWNEGAFKRQIRNRQIVTQVWYATIPTSRRSRSRRTRACAPGCPLAAAKASDEEAARD